MAEVKASGVQTVKKLIAAAPGGSAERFRASLRPETARILEASGATTWIPFDVELEVFERAADVLFPGDPQGLRRLGYTVGRKQFQGLYRIFLTVATVEFVIKRSTQIWNTIYNAGSARVTDVSAHGGTFIAEGLPDQLPGQREYICGYLQAVLEMTDVGNVRVRREDSDPQAWKWIFTWKKK